MPSKKNISKPPPEKSPGRLTWPAVHLALSGHCSCAEIVTLQLLFLRPLRSSFHELLGIGIGIRPPKHLLLAANMKGEVPATWSPRLKSRLFHPRFCLPWPPKFPVPASVWFHPFPTASSCGIVSRFPLCFHFMAPSPRNPRQTWCMKRYGICELPFETSFLVVNNKEPRHDKWPEILNYRNGGGLHKIAWRVQ
ncbi:hypothetical protein B0T21DRAFT_348518 [Apiosordaria backusii]|uniref:Uncharacterized protein n=1 Tax=Apiosordaria backusii TaxID=314023 RepID=A0AA40BLM3_9PEZI|nr:hypothetical protein B0T21DRAFT_348518 [Apiosordaria backusii]